MNKLIILVIAIVCFLAGWIARDASTNREPPVATGGGSARPNTIPGGNAQSSGDNTPAGQSSGKNTPGQQSSGANAPDKK